MNELPRYQITWDASPERRPIVIDTHDNNRVVLHDASVVACYLHAKRRNREFTQAQQKEAK